MPSRKMTSLTASVLALCLALLLPEAGPAAQLTDEEFAPRHVDALLAEHVGLLDIPAEVQVVAITPLGHPATAGAGMKHRKDIEEIVCHDRWNG